MSFKGLWEESKTLWCNKCRKQIDKHNETLEIENNIHCIHCNNWICGFTDAFGEI